MSDGLFLVSSKVVRKSEWNKICKNYANWIIHGNDIDFFPLTSVAENVTLCIFMRKYAFISNLYCLDCTLYNSYMTLVYIIFFIFSFLYSHLCQSGKKIGYPMHIPQTCHPQKSKYFIQSSVAKSLSHSIYLVYYEVAEKHKWKNQI